MSALAEPHLHPRKLSRAGLAGVVALHALVFGVLLSAQTPSAPTPSDALAVTLISPAAMPAVPAVVAPPIARPATRHPVPAYNSTVAAPAAAPAAAEAPAVAASAAANAPPVAPAPVTAPRFDADYLDNPKPAYPPMARRLGEQGRVLLRVAVDAGGLATDVQVQSSSGSPRLDQAALDAVRRWKFVPARREAASVAASVLVPIVFSLKD